MRTIKCQICGKEVEAKSGRQKYCPECAKEVRREKKREQEHERRKDPEYREKRNAREREHKRERRKDPEYREKEREYKRERRKDPEYREKEREYNKTYGKKYRENNKEYFDSYRKNYYETHKEKFIPQTEHDKAKNRENARKYYYNNREVVLRKAKTRYEDTHIPADRKGNNFCVYIHTDPVGKVYIGRSVGNDVKTVNRQRWGGGSGYQGQKFYDECIAVYGWNNIQHEIIEWGLTYEEVLEREQYWIERYNSRNPEYGYNVA